MRWRKKSHREKRAKAARRRSRATATTKAGKRRRPRRPLHFSTGHLAPPARLRDSSLLPSVFFVPWGALLFYSEVVQLLGFGGRGDEARRARLPLVRKQRRCEKAEKRWAWSMVASDCRRSRASAPFATLLVLLLPAFFPGLFTPLGHASASAFSEWNAPKPMHMSLLNGALESRITDGENSDLWSPLPPQGWKPCIGYRSTAALPKKSRGYIQVFLDGGLNQQRMGICDAVAVAKILNATLVTPFLEVNPVWKDSSTFADIFDVDHFIDVLKDEISVVRDLPEEYSWSTREYYAVAIRATRIKTAPVHASANWYLENVLPALRRYGIAAIAPFSHRLAFDNLPEDIQRLRCKVNFQALAFVPHITELGEALIKRLRNPVRSDSDAGNEYLHEASHDNADRSGKKFVALHLRFDKDMAAHSACDFGGGKAEMLSLAKYRQVIWQGRVLNSQFTDEELRSQGRCPLTPEETGLMLAAMGFDRNTRLYLASHKVYGGAARLAALKKIFPLLEDKKSLASEEELAKVKGKASLLAALDYYVSMHSDVFVSASPGNMHNAMAGHRTYENLKTIRPNMVLMGQLFLNKTIGWSELQQAVQIGHSNRQGQIRLRKEKQSIYTYPAPDCMCQM